MPVEPGDAAAEVALWCAFCHKAFTPEDDQLLVMRDGVVVAAYHDACRPDRRRKGCSGC
ncbi:MAG: hypothetical protein JNL26_13185 [Gemmatimonadetes bacterium]|nr:hypothetical protein [Gemmatimonadota bacterium]